MIMVQVMRHRRDILQTVEDIERTATVSIAHISKHSVLIQNCA